MSNGSEEMTIEDKIRAVQAEVQANPDRGDELRRLAIDAIYKGLGSTEWETYMRNFANTPAQLARLTTQADDLCHPYIRQARCYLVANATCLPGTDTQMLDGINGFLDAPCEEG
jgi:hypothetical protein